MADTPTTHYGFLLQQPGTNPGTWGGKLNGNWGSIDGLLFTASTNASNALTLGTAAMPKAGGAFTGPVTLDGGATTQALAVGFRGIPVNPFTTNYTPVLSDAGRMIRYGQTGPVTVTIPPVGTVGFPRGTVLYIRNYSPAVMTIAQGPSVEIRRPTSVTAKNWSVPLHGYVKLTLEDVNMWIIEGEGIS